ncbi:hypothetical protein L873DRAFT_587186 [Choiromyces venosus 120613-1]|uniref:Uncharacterized protein n=1 Tax=Choiromyces venosus 120613-1 TaxID=1336337 RepID=A0A3N4IUF6_9PEZI|nr:hypothetical protein L873DRAFT_587186 [Choiromyces venosus 120613-1]
MFPLGGGVCVCVWAWMGTFLTRHAPETAFRKRGKKKRKKSRICLTYLYNNNQLLSLTPSLFFSKSHTRIRYAGFSSRASQQGNVLVCVRLSKRKIDDLANALAEISLLYWGGGKVVLCTL